MSNAKKKQRLLIWIGTACIALVFLGGGFMVVKMLLSKDEGKRRRQIQSVTLVKPPPPKVEEKPPEPEVEKKEKIIEPEPEETPPEDVNETQDDGPPPGEDLGLDADGSGGADGFGLRAKKGGRDLIGGYGDQSLMRKYAWYTRIMQDELREKVNRYMEKNGGVPDGNLIAFIRISLDADGKVVGIELTGSSGNHKMDNAVQEALMLTSLSEPPPPGMPKIMKVKISSRG